MGLIIKAENDWRHIGGGISSCNASQLPPYLVFFFFFLWILLHKNYQQVLCYKFKKNIFFSNNKLKLAIQWWSDNNSVERAPVDDMLCVEVCDVFFRHFLQSDDLVQVVVVARLSADHHHDRCKSQMEKYPTLREWGFSTFMLMWPWTWPDNLHIRTWPVFPGDTPELQIWNSYVKAFESYRLTYIQCVSKNTPNIFSRNSRKHSRIFIIIGTCVTDKVSNQ